MNNTNNTNTTQQKGEEKMKNPTIVKSSEYCAVGHPDRTCDFIASYILDRYLQLDPNARVALEVQLKDNYCTVSGEVTSKVNFSDEEIGTMCRDAINEVGYTRGYAEWFGRKNAIAGNDVVVVTHLSQQSPDIAQGVAKDGWGDQGIFWGLAVNDPTTGYMPVDYWLARKVANALYDVCTFRYGPYFGGLDIKTLVTVEDNAPTNCVIAIPLKEDDAAQAANGRGRVATIARNFVGTDCNLVINGTGRYVTHGPIGDCGTTGRKLVVDFYGGNSRIGGGSPWGKDPSKADVSLNVLARRKALAYMLDRGLPEVRCSIACCIGQGAIRVCYFDEHDRLLDTSIEVAPPSRVIADCGLRLPEYARRCREGLFGFENVVANG